ncbi:MAG TPA: hypothetical protein EYP09_12065 [Anaerolineae bacterium]|nr:hypothetical protein [Anaerolineae bacterium]
MEEVKRICPLCGAANPLEGRICVRCGADMRQSLPAAPGAGPLVPWREIGGALALGAAYLALELGWRLLRRRLRKLALPSRRSMLPEVMRRLLRREPAPKAEERVGELSLYGERVWEVRQRGARFWGAERFLWRSTRR